MKICFFGVGGVGGYFGSLITKEFSATRCYKNLRGINNEILTENQLPDIEKVKPMLFGSFGTMAYYAVGEKLGKAFAVWKESQQK